MNLKGTTVTLTSLVDTPEKGKKNPDMDTLLREIKQMSKHPKWIEYLNKQNNGKKQTGRGTSKKSQFGND